MKGQHKFVSSEDVRAPEETMPQQSQPVWTFHESRGKCHCWFNRYRAPFLVCGGDWKYSLITLACFFVLALFFVLEMAPHVGEAFQYVGYCCIALQFLTLASVSLMNPGIEYDALRGEWIDSERDKEANYCAICGVSRTLRTRHCPRCSVCVRGYDHHNYLTGNCIGEGNICCFRFAYLQALVCFAYLVAWGLYYQPLEVIS